MNTFQLCLSEATNYTDRDAYISDLALSSVWGDVEGAEVPQDRLDWLGQLWDATHRSVRDIAKAACLSQRKLAERFGISYKTMEAWCGGTRTSPLYVRLMMQECLGLLRHDV